jgi:hypothetical protein
MRLFAAARPMPRVAPVMRMVGISFVGWNTERLRLPDQVIYLMLAIDGSYLDG